MAALSTASAFQSWVLSPQEELQGKIFTITQKQVIQNRIVQLAHTRLNLSYDPVNQMIFLQQDADLRGQILALSSLLDESAMAENQITNPSGV
jgi:hypothetical protein